MPKILGGFVTLRGSSKIIGGNEEISDVAKVGEKSGRDVSKYIEGTY